jgi:hypothetical protein
MRRTCPKTLPRLATLLAVALAGTASARGDIYFGDFTTQAIYDLDPVSGNATIFARFSDVPINPRPDTPFGMAWVMDQGTPHLAVVDKGKGGITEFNPDGSFARMLARTDYLTLSYPADMIALPNGNLLVANTHTNAVDLFQGPGGANPGAHLATIASGPELNSPTGLAYDPSTQRLFVGSSLGDKVLSFHYDGVSGTASDEQQLDLDPTKLHQPADLAIAPDGNLLVAGFTSSQVALVSRVDGHILQLFASDPLHAINQPAAFVVDGSSLYISNYLSGEILLYRYDGSNPAAPYSFVRAVYSNPSTRPLFMVGSPNFNPTPEPSSLALTGVGLAVAAWRIRRRGSRPRA